jgi:hypothetical protein
MKLGDFAFHMQITVVGQRRTFGQISHKAFTSRDSSEKLRITGNLALR